MIIRHILSILFCLLWVEVCAQSIDTVRYVQHQRVMFWNVENAFWPDDDPQNADEEFTPEGNRHWTHGRLRQKLLQLTRVILAAGDGQGPMLVGLAEVEGDSVMEYWTRHTPLWDQHYRYVITHGADQRGIQSVLLYQPSDFRLLSADEHQVELPVGSRPTRRLLHASGRLVSGDTLDVIVCHLPSRLGGVQQTRSSREAAHRALMRVADSICDVRSQPNVIIMGDMNDVPSRRQAWWGSGYSNLMLPLQKALRRHPSWYGSHKYQGEWAFLDQFIINDRLHAMMQIEQSSASRLLLSNPRSFHLPFMLTDDISHLGHRPMRSYYGYQFEGGYSDHLPILLDIDVFF